MRILGIDPGSGSTGYGIIETDGSQHNCDSVRCDKNTGPPTFSRTPSQDPSGSEQYSFAREGGHHGDRRSISRHQRAVGAPAGTCKRRSPCWLPRSRDSVSSNTRRWKSKAPLSDMAGRKKRRFRRWSGCSSTLSEIPSPDDAADALAVAICHANRMRTRFTTDDFSSNIITGSVFPVIVRRW